MGKLKLKKLFVTSSFRTGRVAHTFSISIWARSPHSKSLHPYLERVGWRSLAKMSCLPSSFLSYSDYTLSCTSNAFSSMRWASASGSSSSSFTSSRKQADVPPSRAHRSNRNPSNDRHIVSSSSSSSSSSSFEEEKVLSEVFSSFSKGNHEKGSHKAKEEGESYSGFYVPKFHPKPYPVDKFLSIKSRTLENFVQHRKELLDRHVKLLKARKEQLRRFYASWRETTVRGKSDVESRMVSEEGNGSVPLPPPPPPLSLPLAQEVEVLERKVVNLEEYHGFTPSDELIYRHFDLLIKLGAYLPALQWFVERIVERKRLGPPFPANILNGLVAISMNVQHLFPDASSAGLRAPMAAPLSSVNGRTSGRGERGNQSEDLNPFPDRRGASFNISGSPIPLSPSFSRVPFDVEFAHPIASSTVRKAQAMSSLLSRTAASAVPLHGRAGYVEQLQLLCQYFMNRSPKCCSISSFAWMLSSPQSSLLSSWNPNNAIGNNNEGQFREYVDEEEENLSLASQTLRPPNPYFYPRNTSFHHFSCSSSDPSHHDSFATTNVGIPTQEEELNVGTVKESEEEGKLNGEKNESEKAELVNELLDIRRLANFFVFRGDGGSGAVDNLAPLSASSTFFEKLINSPLRYPPPPAPLHSSYVHHLVLVYILPLLHVFQECGLLFDTVSPIRNPPDEDEDEDEDEEVAEDNKADENVASPGATSGNSKSLPQSAKKTATAENSSFSSFSSDDLSQVALSSFIPIGRHPSSQISAVRKVRSLFPSFSEDMYPLELDETEEEEELLSSSSTALKALQKTLGLYSHMVRLVCESKEPTLMVVMQQTILSGFFHLEPRAKALLSSFNPSEKSNKNSDSANRKTNPHEMWKIGNEKPNHGEEVVLVPVVSEEIWLEDIFRGIAEDENAEEELREANAKEMKKSNGKRGEKPKRDGFSSSHLSNPVSHQDNGSSKDTNSEAGRYLLHHFLQESFLQLSIARQAVFTEKVSVWRTVDMLHSFGALQTLWKSATSRERKDAPPQQQSQASEDKGPMSSSLLTEEKTEKEKESILTSDEQEMEKSTIPKNTSFSISHSSGASALFLCRAFQCWHYEWARTEVGQWVKKKTLSLPCKDGVAPFPGNGVMSSSYEGSPVISTSTSASLFLQGSPSLSCSSLPLFTRPCAYYPFLYSTRVSRSTSNCPALTQEDGVVVEGEQEDEQRGIRNNAAPPAPRTSGGRVQFSHQCWHELWQELDIAFREVLKFQATPVPSLSSEVVKAKEMQRQEGRIGVVSRGFSTEHHTAVPSTRDDLSSCPSIEFQQFSEIRLSEWRRAASIVIELMAPTTCATASLNNNETHSTTSSECHPFSFFGLNSMDHRKNDLLAESSGILDVKTVEMLQINRHWQQELQKCLLAQHPPSPPSPLQVSSSTSWMKNSPALPSFFQSLPRCYTAHVLADIIYQQGMKSDQFSQATPKSSVFPMPSPRMRVVQLEALIERLLLAISLDIHSILLSVPYFPAFYGEAPQMEEAADEDSRQDEGKSTVTEANTFISHADEELVQTPKSEEEGMYYQEAFHEMEDEGEEKGSENDENPLKGEDGEDSMVEASVITPGSSTFSEKKTDDSALSNEIEDVERRAPTFEGESEEMSAEYNFVPNGDETGEEEESLKRETNGACQSDVSHVINACTSAYHHPSFEDSKEATTEEKAAGATKSSTPSSSASTSTSTLRSSTLNYLRCVASTNWGTLIKPAKESRQHTLMDGGDDHSAKAMLYTPPSVEDVCQVFLQAVLGLIVLLQDSDHQVGSLSVTTPQKKENLQGGEKLKNAEEDEEGEEEDPSKVSPAALSALGLLLDACYWVRPVISPPFVLSPSSLSSLSSAGLPSDSSSESINKIMSSTAVLKSLLLTLFPVFAPEAGWRYKEENVSSSSSGTRLFSSLSSDNFNDKLSVEKARDNPPRRGSNVLVSPLSPWCTASPASSTFSFSSHKNNGNAMALMILAAARAGLWTEVEILLSALFLSYPPYTVQEGGEKSSNDGEGVATADLSSQHLCSAVQMDPAILTAIFVEARTAGIPSVCLLLREHREDLFFS